MQLGVHINLIEAEFRQALIPWRITPGFLNENLSSRGKFADGLHELVAERPIRLRVPTKMTALLYRNDIPLLRLERLGDVGRLIIRRAPSLGNTVITIGLEIGLGSCTLDILPMAFERTAADIE